MLKTDIAEDQLPTDETGDVDEEGDPGIELVDEIEDIEGGGSWSLTVQLKAGAYVFICNLPGHFRPGDAHGLQGHLSSLPDARASSSGVETGKDPVKEPMLGSGRPGELVTIRPQCARSPDTRWPHPRLPKRHRERENGAQLAATSASPERISPPVDRRTRKITSHPSGRRLLLLDPPCQANP